MAIGSPSAPRPITPIRAGGASSDWVMFAAEIGSDLQAESQQIGWVIDVCGSWIAAAGLMTLGWFAQS
tara:strand:+ start:81 stop:284 length:204 start_codon:yes stop_codon:yes gene_type:complete